MMYTSKYSELRLIMKPTNRMLDDKGRVVVLPGQKVEFQNYKYATDDPDIIEWMHKHHLNGVMFYEIKEAEVELVKKQIAEAQVKVTTGANTVGNSTSAQVNIMNAGVEIPARPEDKIMLNSDLAEVINRTIDEKIGSALDEIKALLKKDLVKEEKVMTEKSQKTFTCPYCKEPFSSGFKVGKHKPVCPQKPQK